MKCDICGKEGAQSERVNRVYGKGEHLLVIEDVPIVACPNCGESYLTAATFHQIEQIKRHRKRYVLDRSAKVASFAH